ncbi:MAG: hypothetical protein ACKVQK_10985 [Burkholderiales bacterium]
MRIFVASMVLVFAGILTGCGEVPTKTAAAKPEPQGLKFAYPTAQRIPIALTPQERDFMLNEMRYYLDMLWVASDALSRDDFGTVAKVARSRVPAMSATTLPPTLESKLPREFLTYWRATHDQVDELALVAEKSRSNHDTLRQMAVVLQRCNECHALFQFQAR